MGGTRSFRKLFQLSGLSSLHSWTITVAFQQNLEASRVRAGNKNEGSALGIRKATGRQAGRGYRLTASL